MDLSLTISAFATNIVACAFYLFRWLLLYGWFVNEIEIRP